MNARQGRFLLPPLAIAACCLGLPSASSAQVSASVTPGAVTVDTGNLLGILDYDWVTRTKTSTGEIVRRQSGVINVPTLLNVDSDPLPDLIGTIQVLSLDRFTVRIDRAPGEFSALPTLVEAIVDPPAGLLPREHINVGYDARASRAPQTWKTVATLPEDGDPLATTLNLAQESTDAGASVTTVGGLFDGDAAARRNPMGGALTYAPAPKQSTLGLTMGPAMEIRAGASSPVTLSGSAEIVDGTREQRATVDIKALPKQMKVNIAQPGSDQRTVTYEADAKVPSVDATYVDRTNGKVETKVVASAKDVPTGMTVKQTGARSGTYEARGGTLGSVEVGFANGDPRLLPDAGHPYARIYDDGTLQSYAGRIDGLQSASVDATDDLTAELTLGPDARKPLRALVDMPGRHIEGRVSDLPRHLKLTYAPKAGKITYDAFGETIGQIDVAADQDAPFFGRVKRIRGQIADLPAHADVTITPDGGGLHMSTDTPIGRAEALLSSGPDAALPAGQMGAQIEDTATRFTAFGRVKGLQLVDLSGDEQGVITGKAKLASTALRLRYVGDGKTADAQLSQIPSDMTVTMDTRTGKATYEADRGIDSIDATITSDTPLFGRVKRVVARVEGLPRIVTIGLKPAEGDGVDIQASPPVAKVEARLTDGRVSSRSLPTDASGVILTDTADEFSVFGRLFDIEQAKVAKAGEDLHTELRTGKPQDVSISVTGDTSLEAKVEQLPSRLKLDKVGAKITYEASASVPKVHVDASGLPAGQVQRVSGDITGVPEKFEIETTDSVLGVEATQGRFGRIDVEAWDHGDHLVRDPEDGRNKVQLFTTDGRLHTLARVFDLTKFRLGLKTTRVETAFGAATKPLDMKVGSGTSDDPTRMNVAIDDLPRSSTFILTQDTGLRLGWEAASAGTDVDLKLASRDLGADLQIGDLPSSTHVCIGSGSEQCDAASKQRVNVDPANPFKGDKVVDFANDFTAFTSANGIIRLNGRVCLPPTDGDGENRVGDVWDTCIDHTAENRIGIQDLRLRNSRIELSTGNVLDENGEEFDDDLLKLFVKTDTEGIRVGRLDVTNETADKETTIQAGNPALTNSGNFFFGLFDLTGIPTIEDEPRIGQLQCDDLTVAVQLPILGKTDVLPGGGELLVGDVCID